MIERIFLLLEIAVGDIASEHNVPKCTLRESLDYHATYPTMNSLLEILDTIVELGELPRHRYINVPFGHSFDDTVAHISVCTASAYREEIPTQRITINDWFRYSNDHLLISHGIYELRRTLLLHIEKRNVHELLDEYVIHYYETIIESLINASK